MREELETRLYNDFSEFFRNANNPRVSLMCFGFMCGDGWFDLIYELCKEIKEYYGVVPETFSVVEVKEKFGALRFYITYAPRVVHDMIDRAEKRSYRVCEECGKVNDYKKGDVPYRSFYRDKLPWIQTLCDDCLVKQCQKMRVPYSSFISEWQLKNKAPFREV